MMFVEIESAAGLWV